MTTSEKYVTAAYCVVFAIVLIYVLLIAVKLGRLDREVEELEQRVDTTGATEDRETATVG
ncbi:MAG TPA: CcmD family protein [Gaiellaceae bacterium]